MLEAAPTEKGRRIYEIALVEQVMGRPLMLPPEVPNAHSDALCKAFDATMKDTSILEEATKRGIEIDPIAGERINELIAQVSSTPADLA